MKQCQGFFEKLVQSQTRNAFATDSQLYHHAPTEFRNGGGDSELKDAEERASDFGVFKEEKVGDGVLSLIRQRLPPGSRVPEKVMSSKRIRYNGIPYSTHSTHKGNSNVFLKGVETPFTIQKILHIPQLRTQELQNEFWLILRPYRQANVSFDPYKKFPPLRASLWDIDLELLEEMAPISSVEGQFAKCVVPWEGKQCTAVVSLARVRIHSSFN